MAAPPPGNPNQQYPDAFRQGFVQNVQMRPNEADLLEAMRHSFINQQQQNNPINPEKFKFVNPHFGGDFLATPLGNKQYRDQVNNIQGAQQQAQSPDQFLSAQLMQNASLHPNLHSQVKEAMPHIPTQPDNDHPINNMYSDASHMSWRDESDTLNFFFLRKAQREDLIPSNLSYLSPKSFLNIN